MSTSYFNGKRSGRSADLAPVQMIVLSLVAFMIVGGRPGIALGANKAAAAAAPMVKVVPVEAERRVDVLVDGKPFTSYVFPTMVKKPVLYPLRAANGLVVTRGFPIEPNPDEPHDHPHQVGLWFNHGNINGVNFWGAHDRNKPEETHNLGTIVHRAVKKAQSGKGVGRLMVAEDWVDKQGAPVLRSDTAFTFSAVGDARIVDRIATLKPVKGRAEFADDKEGSFGLRLRPSLQLPEPPKAGAKPKPAPVVAPTGNYTSSEGKTGDAVWGTRARWMMLTGKVDDQPVTVAMFDHPKNPNYPTYWHARGYGLFAANPFGQRAFDKTQEIRKVAIEAGKSARFAYRVLIIAHEAKPEEIEAEYKRFLAQIK
jgi:hypothetical protein